MTDIVSLGATGLAFFAVAVSPGPANISNANIAMGYGRKVSLLYAMGLSCGLAFWGMVAASGMGAVLQSSVYLLMALKVFGGLYLLWLAFLSGRAAWRSEPDKPLEANDKRWFIRGFVLNISNPKSVIAWMAALSIGVDANDGFSSVFAAMLVCIIVGFLTNTLYSILFSMGGMMRAYQTFRRRINGAISVLFAAAGFGLIRSAISR